MQVMYRRSNREVLAELRYALQVMDENSHLGLDDQAADNLRAMLLRRIAKVESELAREASRFPDADHLLHKLPE
jgi:hypothetical protein